jgi:hypothetical protein
VAVSSHPGAGARGDVGVEPAAEIDDEQVRAHGVGPVTSSSIAELSSTAVTS